MVGEMFSLNQSMWPGRVPLEGRSGGHRHRRKGGPQSAGEGSAQTRQQTPSSRKA